MTDEKMAEEKYCKGCKWRMEQCLWAWRNTNGLNEPNEKNCSCKEVPAFLAGLKAGRPQWHDLRKDPNDLPKEHISVLVMLEYGVPYISSVSTDKRWFCTDYYTGEDKVIAWQELPAPPKESE